MRVARIGLLVALALAASGCGAKKQSSASGAAEIVPATAPVFVSIDSNLSSGQWSQVDELLDRFEGREELTSALRSSLEGGSGLDYEEDVKPALGDEIAVVWLDLASDGSNVVALTKPKDDTKFEFLVDKASAESGDELTFGKLGDWYVVADAQQKIDRFLADAESGDKLADNALYTDALEELPDESLVHVFARGKSIVDALESIPGAGTRSQALGNQRPEFLSAALAAEGTGFRLVGAGRVEADSEIPVESFESRFLDEVPADAVAFVTFRGGEEFERQLKELEKDEAYREGVQELRRMLGVRLDNLLSIFSHEVALYVRPGSPIPEVTLLLDAPDEQEVLGRVNTALQALTKTLPAQPCHAPPEEAGVAVKCIDLGGIEVRTAAFDDKVVLTTGQDAISKLRGDGPRLADDEGFKSAREAAGLPNESAGFIWVDLEDGLPLILGLAAASGESIPADVRANLEPLGSFLAWAESDGRSGSFTAFLQID